MTKKKPPMAIRLNNGKCRMDLLSPIATRGTATVLTKNLSKYEEHNWRKGMPWSYCIASLKRHLNDFEEGIDFDECGEPQVDMMACNIMMLQEFFRTFKQFDDRYKLNDKKGKK